MAKDWKDLSSRVVSSVGLRSRPVGFKFFKHADELKEIEGIEQTRFKKPLCQFIGSVRYLGKAWGATAGDQLCHAGAWCLGIFPYVPEAFASGELYTQKVLNIANAEIAKRIAEGLPKNKDKFTSRNFYNLLKIKGFIEAEEI